MSYTCREANKADLPTVQRLYAQVFDQGQQLSLAQAEAIFDKIATYPFYKFYVAETADKQVVGTLTLAIMDNLEHLGAKSGLIEAVAVDPAYQGQGIGKLMLQYAMQLAAEQQCYKVALSSNLQREKAHRFYDQLGFERHGYSFRTYLKSERI